MLSHVFACRVFTDDMMQSSLPPEVLQQLKGPEPLPVAAADAVAQAMKNWAISLGATHYCHWFQPLTGATAEKHMSFLSAKGLPELTGRQLLKGESDASSFPTGGLRQTAYARGFTAWDRSSPVFVKDTAAGRVLCIPSVFASADGSALDLKTPLLRSMEALNTQALRLLHSLGRTEVQRVIPMVGAEQEYFLIDRQKYLQRRDLRLCGRTLFGARPTKGQQLDDQYYASISTRAGAFMQSLDRALWELGIPAAVRHNEVAPAQHELAPHYAPANIACDRDQLTMETMRHLARKLELHCLLHEKPFAYVNGSGKHNNWSLVTDTGENLLEPGEAPEENRVFQLILACILQAVDTHSGLLRLSAGSLGNDARLGGQEAPPMVLSVYLGGRLEAMTAHILGQGAPENPYDDRNRTTPMAFTGNKFEFRMVGASESIAMANTVLNTIVADAFGRSADALQGQKDRDAACKARICQLLRAHSRIIFSGDCYDPAWSREAQSRGLTRYTTQLEAVEELTTEKAFALFEGLGVFTRQELVSRANVLRQTYCKRQRIEAEAMLQITRRDIVPGVLAYCTAAQAAPELTLLLRQRLRQLWEGAEALQENMDSPAAMEALRTAADQLEELVGRPYWPMPSYEDVLLDI